MDSLYDPQTAIRAFQALHLAYLDWRQLLEDPDSSITGVSLRQFYESKVEKRFQKHAILNPALFDKCRYSSLFGELPVHANKELVEIDLKNIPKNWNKKSVSRAARGSDIARLLLAFVWKQGDFDKVKHVLAGLRSPSRCDLTDATVLRQFGRHLAQPLRMPIFDQHTSRQFLVYAKLTPTTQYEDFKLLFGGRKGLIPTTPQPLRSKERCRAFIEWWDKSLMSRDSVRQQSARSKANIVLWSDRIMFSLGKAAAILRSPRRLSQDVDK
jgi:hypothetical protein